MNSSMILFEACGQFYTMNISIIAAIGSNHVIGSEGKLLWHMPADMKRFKELTTGKTVIMGRRTYESIGRPLPQRTNIILTRSKNFFADGCIVVNSLDESMELAENEDNIFVIGGASVYEQFLPHANKMYLTLIEHAFDGDTLFPNFDMLEWRETQREQHKKDDKNPYNYTFVTMERIH